MAQEIVTKGMDELGAAIALKGTDKILVDNADGSQTATMQQVKEFAKEGLKTSEIQNDSNFVDDPHYQHTDNNFTNEEKQKLEQLQPGGGSSGATDYSALSNKPSIGGVTLEGNKTPEQLGLQPKMEGTTIATINGTPIPFGGKVDLPGGEGGGAGIVVEKELNTESTNAIQNGTVAKEFAKVDKELGKFDNTTFESVIDSKATWTKGLVVTDGSVRTGGSFDNYSTSSEIPVKEGDVIRAYFRSIACKNAQTGAYDKSLGFNQYEEKEFTIPKNVNAIKVSVMLSQIRVLIVRKVDAKVAELARKRICVKKIDSQEDIFLKMLESVQTRNCDVYFEPHFYLFDSIFQTMKEKYSLPYLELPIGGNSRYFFNGSTLKAVSSEVDHAVINLLGSWRMDGGYELHDGNLQVEGTRYVLHDETTGSLYQYNRLCNHINFYRTYDVNSAAIDKIVGGGMGQWGMCKFEHCVFDRSNDNSGKNKSVIGYHGPAKGIDTPSAFNLTLSNCYVNGDIGVYTLAANQSANVLISSCKTRAVIASEERINLKKFCCETITE